MTTTPQLNLIVVRSLNPRESVHFYELLGMQFQEEQHGKGPLHWAAVLGQIVLEIYPARNDDDVDRSTRLGFAVGEIATMMGILHDADIVIVQNLAQSASGLRAVVRDPDGRAVELVQNA